MNRKKTKNIRVLFCAVGKPAEVRTIENSLKGLQELVGGDIQCLYNVEKGLDLYCNENGGLLKLPFNRNLPGEGPIPTFTPDFVVKTSPDLAGPGEPGVHRIRGDFFLARHSSSGGGTIDVTDADIEKYSGLMAEWIACRRCGQKAANPEANYCGAACAAEDRA